MCYDGLLEMRGLFVNSQTPGLSVCVCVILYLLHSEVQTNLFCFVWTLN